METTRFLFRFDTPGGKKGIERFYYNTAGLSPVKRKACQLSAQYNKAVTVVGPSGNLFCAYDNGTKIISLLNTPQKRS